MFCKRIIIRQARRWKQLSSKQKLYLWNLSKNKQVILLSPQILSSSVKIKDFDEETTFIWSLDFLLYLYSFFQPKIIFNFKLISICPFRRHKTARKINQFLLNFQKKVIPFYKFSKPIQK